MTTVNAPPAATPMRVSSWLLADTQEATLVLNHVITSAPRGTTAEARRLGMLAKVARAALVDEVLTNLRAVLDDNLVDLLVTGWQKHAAMTDAARESLADPGSQRTVVMAKHRITSRRQPQLEVQVDGLHVLTLSISCEVAFQVVDAVAVVRDGRLMGLRSGESDVTGTITVEGQEIARRSLQLPLTAELNLGNGLRLIRYQD